MERYDFKVREVDGTISVVHTAVLSDLCSVWSVVADIAHEVDEVGVRIVVTNDLGEVVILVGVATARSYSMARKQPNLAAPMLVAAARAFQTVVTRDLRTETSALEVA
jgi:hypothetical protein